jgi:hypothetical protein
VADRRIDFRPRRVPARPETSSPFRKTSGTSRRTSSPSFGSSWDVSSVLVEWDGVRALHVARCERCAESFDSVRIGEVERWADTHRCDPELAALLTSITTRRAA